MGWPTDQRSDARLQFMILISALLASLTGLVAGERPAERARVELSTVAQAVQSSAVAMHRADRPVAKLPRLCESLNMPDGVVVEPAALSLGLRTLLALKQSWLE